MTTIDSNVQCSEPNEQGYREFTLCGFHFRRDLVNYLPQQEQSAGLTQPVANWTAAWPHCRPRRPAFAHCHRRQHSSAASPSFAVPQATSSPIPASSARLRSTSG